MGKLIFLLMVVHLSNVIGWNKHMEVPGMFQGDIQLTPEQRQQLVKNGRAAFGSIVGKRWPNAVIPYYVESSLDSTARSAISSAIADYHKYTCLRFRAKTSKDRNYISFFKGTGCNSPVGMHRVNRISIGEGCADKGTVLHEIGHSIGLEHEQSRPDRDAHVNINFNNIDGDWDYAFDIVYNIDSLGTPYDLKSMMHYSSTAFAKAGMKTITTVDPSKQSLIDNYNHIYGFSRTDIQQIKKMYQCQ
ncbi:protein SpAN-like isoform X3 [Hydractinia symbiolongicarpus]|uniref:protein SpAN-like isoform X3 n=1 Tax=Hydractinia symbiolongicarpus TaxID=13093 RepID=UPI00254A6E6E|nr:protein SpAN-like isoform X3 [Hydractinia symbiolongicarpus]